ncbi:hypothetical protein HC928_21360 [bacterium]|nr:hypothetical protein [bacterium]
MQPGLTRAIPMAFLGFIFGALFVIVLRALQSIEPLWDPQLGLVMCAFTITAGFVWGMGAFDPRMNQHAHEPSEHDEDTSAHAEPEPEPRSVSILGYSMGQVATWTVVLMIVLFAYAIFGGRYVRTTSDPIASPANIGFMPVQVPFSGDYITWNGEVVLFSELTLFVMLVVITLGRWS